MSSYPEPGAGVYDRAPTGERTLDIALYSCLTDTAAQIRPVTREQLA